VNKLCLCLCLCLIFNFSYAVRVTNTHFVREFKAKTVGPQNYVTHIQLPKISAECKQKKTSKSIFRFPKSIKFVDRNPIGAKFDSPRWRTRGSIVLIVVSTFENERQSYCCYPVRNIVWGALKIPGCRSEIQAIEAHDILRRGRWKPKMLLLSNTQLFLDDRKQNCRTERIGYTWRNWTHLEKLNTLGKTGHSWKKKSHLKMGNTWENGRHLKKIGSLKIGNGSLLKKRIKLEICNL